MRNQNFFSFFSFLFLISSFHLYAQLGCTDISASNYNASALVNDGSCLYPTTYRNPVLKFGLISLLTESSGLNFTDGKLWSHDDSGNSAELYAIDTTDGHLVQRILVDNYPNTDWEEISSDSLYLYVGDFGNNSGTRTDLKILRIKKADISSAAVVHVNADAINFSYADQVSFVSSNSHNFDCESMIVLKDSIYLFSKDRGDFKTRVYKVAKLPGTYVLSPYTNYTVNGLITGASYNKVKKEIVLIGYQNNHAASFLWYLNDFTNDQFFNGNKRRIEIGNASDWQTEGICWVDSSTLFISNETSSAQVASLYRTDKLFQLNTEVQNANKSIPIYYPNPTNGLLRLAFENNEERSIKLFSTTMQELKNWKSSEQELQIDLRTFPIGTYFLKIKESNKPTTESQIKVIKQD
jgi:hypothetical protein